MAMKLSLLLLTTVFGLIACRARPTVTQHPAQPLLVFQKTPCLGICPFYEAHIATDGSILFIGREHVPVVDTVHFQLAPAELKALRQEIDKLNVSQLRDSYMTEWSDMPSTISTFYENGKEVKRVKHQEGGPQALLDFQDRLHRRLMEFAEAEAKKRLPVR